MEAFPQIHESSMAVDCFHPISCKTIEHSAGVDHFYTIQNVNSMNMLAYESVLEKSIT